MTCMIIFFMTVLGMVLGGAIRASLLPQEGGVRGGFCMVLWYINILVILQVLLQLNVQNSRVFPCFFSTPRYLDEKIIDPLIAGVQITGMLTYENVGRRLSQNTGIRDSYTQL